jgi:hypothetical protein
MKNNVLLPLIACTCLAGLENADAASSLFDIPSFYWGTQTEPGETHGNGMVGYVFRVTQSVTVTQVGWYDAQGDGLSRAFQVGLWKDLTGGNFDPGSPTSQLLGNSNNGIFIPKGTNATLSGVWRVVNLQSALILDPGTYQIGGLDTSSTTDPIVYVSQNVESEMLTNANATAGQFFYSPTTSSAPGFHATDNHHFYLAGGLELGPMLFIIPEPSCLFLTAVGLGGLLSARRRRSV